MNDEICGNCSQEDRKSMGFLCDKIEVEDGLPVRCIHSQSELKLKLLRYYLDIVCEGMKIKFKDKRYFIDLFSGPGLCWNRDDHRFVDGSSIIAIDQKTPFTDYIFVDSNPKTCNALKRRCEKQFPNLMKHISLLNLNSNSTICEIADSIKSGKKLIVVFIDPNAFDIHYDIIKRLSKFRSIDLIINFAIHDLQRNARRYKDGTSEKANKVFGCNDWPDIKSEWLSFYKKKLINLGFIAVEEDFEQKAKIKTKLKADIYYLIYASKHPTGLKFWREAKKRYLENDMFAK